jgi:hypothetical protein
MSYVIQRGQWYDIVVLNVHASTEDKTDQKDSFHKEVGRVFDKFSNYEYHTKILL